MTPAKQITVMHFPVQPHFFSYGGFDIQMNRVIEMTNRRQIIAKKVDLWSRKETFDIAHFWGAADFHRLNMRLCKENKIKVVVSGLFPQKILKNRLKIKLLETIRGLTRNKSVIYNADIVTVINEDQADVVANYYGYPREQIKIIPTILDDELFMNHEAGPTEEAFVLCVGTIFSRKNQLVLAKACAELGIKCVFVGRFDSREPLYRQQFLEIVHSSNGLINHAEDISAGELYTLYMQCGVVACLSLVETEPAVILEAMHFQKPIIASNLPFAKNPKFKGIKLCDQNSVDSVKKALISSLEKNGITVYTAFSSKDHQSTLVQHLYTDLYAEMLAGDNK
jgi:glycosyltransferase involved in cell wall biosynthesis